MISVAEDDLCLHLVVEVAVCDTLHAANRANGHEDGSLYLTVVGGDESGAGIGTGVCMLKLKCHIACKGTKNPPLLQELRGKCSSWKLKPTSLDKHLCLVGQIPVPNWQNTYT